VISPALVQPTRRTAEALLQGLAQRLQVVFGGAEEQHEAQVRMQQLPRQVLGGLPGSVAWDMALTTPSLLCIVAPSEA
jgi:hypothetical protein